MNKYLLSLFFMFFNLLAYSQVNFDVAGARSAAMGNAGLTLHDSWAVFSNPAAINADEHQNIGLYYENKFLMNETSFGALAFTTPLLGGNVGVGITHFGFELFQQNKFALGYSQQLFKNFYMGVMLDYFSIRQSEYYGNFNAMTFEIGFLAKPTEELSIATYIFNPLNLSYFEDSNAKIPVTLKLGFSYLFSKKLLLAIETGKSINGDIPIFKSGLEYKINKNFAFRGGVSMKPVEYTFGIGYCNYGFNFDLAFGYHQVLGITPKISVRYGF